MFDQANKKIRKPLSGKNLEIALCWSRAEFAHHMTSLLLMSIWEVYADLCTSRKQIKLNTHFTKLFKLEIHFRKQLRLKIILMFLKMNLKNKNTSIQGIV